MRATRRFCIKSFALVLLVLIVTVVLRSLTPGDFSFGGPFGMDLVPRREDAILTKEEVEPEKTNITQTIKLLSGKDLENVLKKFPPPNYYLHAFYYIWYGNPTFDKKYIHWNHPYLRHWDVKVAHAYPHGKHNPPEDIGSNFYPYLGVYSSKDPSVIEAHMQQLRQAAIGVIAVSWYPPNMNDNNGEPVDSIIPVLLEAAYKYKIKVAFHIEPYEGRNEINMFTNIQYITDLYCSHPAVFKYKTKTGKMLPLFYVYDSYLTTPQQWARLLKHTASDSIRDSPYDAIFIALLVENRDHRDILIAGFDGVYTYFATNGFSYGSTQSNWRAIKDFCDENEMLFIPSVGPGYADTNIRPWNFHNTRNRINGKYYETAMSAALESKPDFISITSFNEWHEGTQIEMAVPKKSMIKYLDYLPNRPDIYLDLTRKWSMIFHTDRHRRRN